MSINEKYIIIVQFINPAHVGLIYSKLNNLKEGSLINFSDYVLAELYKRHRDLNAICQILRKKYDMSTHIRLGLKDYKLYTRKKDDKTKWNECKTFYLSEEIEKFEIGTILSTNKRLRSDLDQIYIENMLECLEC